MTSGVDGAAAEPAGSTLAADPLGLRRSYAVETARLVRARLDVSLPLFIVFMGIDVLFERRMPGHESVVVAYAAEIVICLVAFALTRIPRLAEHVTAIATVATSGLALAMVIYSAYVGSPADAVAIGQVCMMTCLAVVLPWGWRAQLVLAGTSFVSFTAALPLLAQTSPSLFALVGMVTGATSSCVAAIFLDRYRFEAFTRAAERSRAYALQEEEAEISTALLHVGQTLSQLVGRSDLLEQVNRLVTGALGCDWSSTFVLDEQADALRFVANVGSREEVRTELEHIDFPLDSLPLFEELRRGHLVEVPDARTQSVVPPDLLLRWEVASMMCVPICRNDRLTGFIASGYRTRTGPFTRKQRRLAIGIAQAVAVGLENERLIRDLRAANRLKSDFVSTMSHELRTPLNVILGYAEMLGEAPGLSAHDTEHLAQGIRRSATELLELVTATLDLGRMESGRDVLRVEPVALAELLHEVELEFEPLSQRAGLTVTWRNDCDSEVVATDRVKLKTIVKNLVGNAIKYTPQGSVDVRVRRDGDDVVLAVADTGIGIDQQDVATIFEMFRQIDGSATRTYGGVGLGLYIVRQLVERLRGRIEVASEPGAGSTFTVRLPLERLAPRATNGREPAAPLAPAATAARSD
ncbi:MAG: HAMP domain-containing sensor histidine kinase [Thermodesulfobacteriota bacterium]